MYRQAVRTGIGRPARQGHRGSSALTTDVCLSEMCPAKTAAADTDWDPRLGTPLTSNLMVQAGSDVNVLGTPSGSSRLGFCGRVSRIVTCARRRHTEVKRKTIIQNRIRSLWVNVAMKCCLVVL